MTALISEFSSCFAAIAVTLVLQKQRLIHS